MAKSIFEQTGWARPYPHMILQGDKLERITDLDYDLNDMSFVRYFEGRTGIMITHTTEGHPDNPESLGVVDWPKRKQLLDPLHPATSRHERITQARIQDCWEIYQTQRRSYEIQNMEGAEYPPATNATQHG